MFLLHTCGKAVFIIRSCCDLFITERENTSFYKTSTFYGSQIFAHSNYPVPNLHNVCKRYFTRGLICNRPNQAADATPRYPASTTASLSAHDLAEQLTVATIYHEASGLISIPWQSIVDETMKDPVLSELGMVITAEFEEVSRTPDVGRSPAIARSEMYSYVLFFTVFNYFCLCFVDLTLFNSSC